MQTRRLAFLSVLALGILGSSFPTHYRHVHGQERMPVSYVCTMDPDILEDKPGSCPICKMVLQPVRIESGLACPVHPNLRIYDKPGKCPVDKRDLVPMVVNHFWDCGEKPERFYPDPGKCLDGRPREERRVVRAHGDHNPRHGGQFFMAEDKWHHLEGTYPKGGPLRLYLYDNFTKDLEPRDVRAISGQAVVLDGNHVAGESVPLTRSRDGKTLEARITNIAFPLRVQARVKFKEATRDQPFDFTFPSATMDPTPPAPVLTGASVRASSPPATTPRTPSTPPPLQAISPPPLPPAAGLSTAVVGTAPDVAAPAMTMSRTTAAQLDLPNTSAELLKLLELRRGEVKSLIEEGNLGMVYVPAMLAKDVSLALADHGGELREDQSVPMTLAVKRVVVAAWQLDQYGDLGDREKLTRAYNDFAAAIADITTAYAAR